MEKMEKNNLEENVMKTVGDHLGIPHFRLSLQTDLIEDLGADSLDLRELIMTLEEQFMVKIPIDEILGMKKIVNIIESIRKYKELI